MNKFNWGALKNDARLNAAQKKTVNKILMSLQVPARDKFRNRPPLNFNISGKTVAQVNTEVRKRLPKVKVYNNPVANENVFYNARSEFNENKNLASQMLRQHRQAYGN